ncbi:tripartite motif-containing protein 16 [Lepisosteus oculatus]|uniref:tripartite motif-containing protein 16 n=1 Tax=Lepisosteus oculatus TaxID=7918 RepID=UPI00371ACF81
MPDTETAKPPDRPACPICSGGFEDPVTFECGHCFCRGCLGETWDKAESKDVSSCPQCQDTSQFRTPPGENGLMNGTGEHQAETVEEFNGEKTPEEMQEPGEGEGKEKAEEVERVEEEETPAALGPDDVVCDSCIETHSRAVKSCLTCMVSYCESHLRPHLENVKFQNHRLVEPLRDIESRTCETHRQSLDVFCLADNSCLCQGCMEEGHRGHNTVPVGDARKQIEEEMRKKCAEMIKTLTAAENAISKLETNTKSIENSVKDVKATIEEQFSALVEAVEKAKKEVKEFLVNEKSSAVKQAEGIKAHLEQKCTELKKTQVQVEKLSKKKNDIDFLQDYCEWKQGAPDVTLPGVYIGLMDRLPSFSRVVIESTKEICGQLLSTYRDNLKEVCKNDKCSIKTTVHAIIPLKHHISMPEPQTRSDFLKYTSPMTFDPDTAHRFLRLTEDNRKVTNTTPWQHPYMDVPERFEHWRQVLASESFYLGRHYFEADISGEGTHVGVTYKSIDRKGQENNSCITGNDFSWCLQWNAKQFSAWHSDVETPLKVEKFTRIGVYVDYSRGVLGFYGVADTMTLIHKYKAKFQEPLYPAFWLSKKENTVQLVGPGDAPPQKTPSAPPTLPTIPTLSAPK